MSSPLAKLLLAPTMAGALFAAGQSPAAAAAPDINCPAGMFCIWATPNREAAPDMTWTPGTGKVGLNETVYKQTAAWRNNTSEIVCIWGDSPNSGAYREYTNPGSGVDNATGTDAYYGTDVGPIDPSTGWCAD